MSIHIFVCQRFWILIYCVSSLLSFFLLYKCPPPAQENKHAFCWQRFEYLGSFHFCLSFKMSPSAPDLTFAVDWALKNNYLSIKVAQHDYWTRTFFLHQNSMDSFTNQTCTFIWVILIEKEDTFSVHTLVLFVCFFFSLIFSFFFSFFFSLWGVVSVDDLRFWKTQIRMRLSNPNTLS